VTRRTGLCAWKFYTLAEMSKMGFMMAKLTVIPEDFLRKVMSHKK